MVTLSLIALAAFALALFSDVRTDYAVSAEQPQRSDFVLDLAVSENVGEPRKMPRRNPPRPHFDFSAALAKIHAENDSALAAMLMA